MVSETINHDQVLIALDRVDGGNFEKFFHAFYPTIGGEAFVPLGGTRDGGADAFQGNTVFELGGSGCYYQASIMENYRDKIRQTVQRLIEFGRTPTTLIYFTSKQVKQIDLEERNLTTELKTIIKIRDKNYITANINYNSSTRAAFKTYLSPQLEFLKSIGSAESAFHSNYATSPAIFVFLRQEIQRRKGKGGLLNALADGLILWALEGTDPDQSKFLDRQEIIRKIEQAVPSAKTILRGIIPHRLEHLAKLPSSSRPIRRYNRSGQYCLSYAYRKNIEAENAEDEALQISVIDIFETRIASKLGDQLGLEQRNLAAKLTLEVLNKTFEVEGIELAAFLQKKQVGINSRTLADHVESCLIEKNINYSEFSLFKDAILENLRGAFYDSTEQERLFFSKLSSTYTLLFCLNTEPRIVEYFQNMASDFFLFVGADIIVQILSEKYLRPEDQMMTNTLNIIKDAGGKLVLTEQVLNEVHAHIKVSHYEYENYFKDIEHSLNNEIARHSNLILIRAYFYAKFAPPAGVTGPNNWAAFINQFCDYDKLLKPEGWNQIKIFLQHKFQMEFFTAKEMSELYNQNEVAELSQKLQNDKKDDRLATNDAILALAVYGRRKKYRETSRVSEFGYRTWWLTSESRILRHTETLVKEQDARYMIRPEFILNFITLAPSSAEVRGTYRNIFPSVLGIQLARRVDPSQLTSVLRHVREAEELEPARKAAVIANLSNTLKGDFARLYEHTFNQSSLSD